MLDFFTSGIALKTSACGSLGITNNNPTIVSGKGIGKSGRFTLATRNPCCSSK
jgi:hypothetical protein